MDASTCPDKNDIRWGKNRHTQVVALRAQDVEVQHLNGSRELNLSLPHWNHGNLSHTCCLVCRIMETEVDQALVSTQERQAAPMHFPYPNAVSYLGKLKNSQVLNDQRLGLT